ncbi:hypothetical protein Rhopal_000360-T1 [Rhodotorula paludigena]|uniref:Protein CPL1-like domain-containing protein n=1 Tax=Rhodotorula paludigena TaxID=86838 RepID=A0AAV5G4Q1_9BASI|nr:hypothetical protein Rhopal_000360-T1 [Rhodotorula paludigena]
MRSTFALSLVALVASFAAAEPASSAESLVAVDPAVALNETAADIEKRGLCLLGIGDCGNNYQTDVNNCGAANNRCPTTWANGRGSQCVGGQCFPGSCNSGFTLSTATRSCVNTASDPANCGGAGRVCSVANGVAGCSSGTCTIASCNPGYTLTTQGSLLGLFGSSSSCTAVNTASDLNNCGQVGKVCTFPNGGGVCAAGQCVTTTCSPGFYLVGGQCTTLNLQSDVNNCGSVGKVCTASNGVAQCSNGQCSLAGCNPGYTMTTDGSFLGLFGSTSYCKAVDLTGDVNNCGAIGRKCSFTNGVGTCTLGQCTYTSCNLGYYPINGQCTSLNLNSDINNCGAVGRVCPSSLGTAQCLSGTCRYSACAAGYSLLNGQCTQVNTQSDPNNCGRIGNVCPSSYSNGGAASCIAGACTTTCNSGYVFDPTFNYCRDVATDANNCGAIGYKCAVSGALSQRCSGGMCMASSCSAGLTLLDGTCKTLNLQSDVNNCGSVGNVCNFSPNGAGGTCSAGRCVTMTCPTGYALRNGACALSASQGARAKRSKITKPKTLCPTGEQACPIVGSTSFEGAVKQHFSTAEEFTGIMAGSGGYECIDTQQALDSCGGCASTGEGQDCTKIRGAAGVGCSAGQCVVFSCQAGYKPSLAGDRCVRTRSSHHGASNHTTGHSAKRHLAARQHSGAFH